MIKNRKFILKVSKDYIFGDSAFKARLASHIAKISLKVNGILYQDVIDVNNDRYYAFDFSTTIDTNFFVAVQYDATSPETGIPYSLHRSTQYKYKLAAPARISSGSSTASKIDVYQEYDGIRAGIAYACKTVEVKRAIIYVEGIDVLDFYGVFNKDVDTIYKYMIKSPLGNMRNYGYDIYVVDWMQSTISMKENAQYLIKFIKMVQDQYSEPVVLIGESMGGVICRYALTYMEKHGPDHKVRYFLSIDASHQGANIPLSVQASYRKMIDMMGPIAPCVFDSVGAEQLITLLDQPAVKELLINHLDAPDPSNSLRYTRHPDGYAFWKELHDMEDYPKHCKKVAIANGSIKGNNVWNSELQVNRTPGDKMLEVNLSTSAIFLWWKIPIVGFEAFMTTNKPDPSGAELLRVGTGFYKPRIRMTWRGLKLSLDWVPALTYSFYADAPAYCTQNSSRYVVGSNPLGVSTKHYGLAVNIFGIVQSSYSFITDPTQRCFIQGHTSSTLIAGAFGASVDANFCSDGFDFGFIPVASAFDDKRGVEAMIGHDYFNEPLASKLSNTPFDAIVGANTYYDRDRSRGNYNYRHYDMCATGDEHLGFRDNIAMDGSCKGLPRDNFWMADIGGHNLYLNNVDFNYSSTMTSSGSVYGDKIMIVDPTYQPFQNEKMAWQYDASQPNYGCYTKKKGATTSNSAVINLVIGKPPYFANNYQTPAASGFTLDTFNIYPCCLRYDTAARKAATYDTVNAVGSNRLIVKFINPIEGNELSLWHNQVNQEMHYSLYTPQGQKLFETSSYARPDVVLELPLLSAGSYFLKVSTPNTSQTYTLIKQ